MSCAKIIQSGCERLHISLEKGALEHLVRYYGELVKWNQKMNLVSQASEKEMVENHFLDSLLLLPFLENQESPSLADVGTGAGFPGLVLKAVLPQLALTLIEPRSKRVSFLRHIIRTLALDTVTVEARRLESIAGHAPEQYPCITSRAVASVADFLSLVSPYSPTGGTVICMKGPKAEEEIKQWQANCPDSPYTIDKIIHKSLPFSGASRNLIFFKKQ